MTIARRKIFISMMSMIVVLVISCASTHQYELADDFRNYNIVKVAVLPPANLTADLDAPDLFRPIVESEMRERGYEVISPEEINKKLADLGVHYAGQLGEFTPDELGNILGADALLYTTVTELKTVYLVAYVQLTVGGRFELVYAASGKQLWLWEDTVTDVRIATRKEDLLATGLFVLMPYKPYIEILVQRAFRTLPAGGR